jgi:hypothetical protein
MGVDWITCQNPKCNYNFPDCGDFNYCGGCDSMFCSDCGKIQAHESDKEEKMTCILCRGEEMTDAKLLKGLLKHYKMTRKEAIKKIRNV